MTYTHDELKLWRQTASPRFMTHKKEIVTGHRLFDAVDKVAKFFEINATMIYLEDEYAAHVTDETKRQNYERGLKFADEIREFKHLNGFTVWQRVNTILTGECIPLLP